ncbi:fla cluster protein FlaF [Salarchaeum japonicum]|uniref:Flagellar protein FlaF n=1 Tax=Salarchaeum japonicum TaxID=555573 RepID=A0AAV3T068_9EURY|nr:fla cluster protein FlaF [Salarchaeum japonicum]
MGFSTNGAAAILFVAAFMVVGVVVPAAQAGFEDISDSMGAHENRALATGNTDITLDDVTYNNTSDELTVRVANTGTTSLHVNDTDLLVDGVFTNPGTAVEGASARTVWAPGENLTLTLSLANEPARVVVVTEYAVSEGTNDVTVVS